MSEEPHNDISAQEPVKQAQGRRPPPAGAGIAIGVCLGAGVGLPLQNPVLGLAIGVAFAAAFESAFKRQRDASGS